MTIQIVHDDETLAFYRSRKMTKYDADDIRKVAAEYSEAYEKFNDAIVRAHETRDCHFDRFFVQLSGGDSVLKLQ